MCVISDVRITRQGATCVARATFSPRSLRLRVDTTKHLALGLPSVDVSLQMQMKGSGEVEQQRE